MAHDLLQRGPVGSDQVSPRGLSRGESRREPGPGPLAVVSADAVLAPGKTNTRSDGGATTGDITEFELGDSEVKRARACTGRGRAKEEYRVIFVSYVLDSRRRRLDVLPNPLDPDNRAFYRFPGSGLRCSFEPA